MAGRIGRRVRRLEEVRAVGVEPSATELEVWAIDAEIERLEREIRAAGGSVEDALRPSAPAGLTLDEEIAWLKRKLEEEYD